MGAIDKICKVGFLILLVPCPTEKNNGNEVPRWFSDMWVPELLLPHVIIRMFGPKTAIFALNYALLGSYRPCRLIWCPVGWWLWRAGCISQDTYLLYDYWDLTATFNLPRQYDL